MGNKYTGFVYIWYDRKRKWYYIGSHMGTINDGYIGSNIRLQRAYNKRPEDFKRKILRYYYGSNQKELLLIEQYFLNKINNKELCLSENEKNETVKYYNIKKDASGLSGKIASLLKKQWWDSDKSDKWRSELSEIMKVNNPSQTAAKSENGWIPWNKGKKSPQISSAKKGKPSTLSKDWFSRHAKNNWENGAYDNRPKPSEETKRKISETSKSLKRKQSNYQKKRASETQLGIPKTKEHKEKISEAAKIRFKKNETCYVCGFIGSGPVMQRWHMSNCKNNKL